jgi:signal transduction histidine kinase
MNQPVSSPRVLLVDDEPSVLLTCSLLMPKHMGLVTARDGDQALSVLAESGGALELALVDLTMPGLSGPGLIRRLRADYPRLKVVVMSGLPPESTTSLLEGLTTDGYLVKPFRGAALLALLEEHLGAVHAADGDGVAGVELPCRVMMDHAAEGILAFRCDGRCVYLNAAARTMLGITVSLAEFRPPARWADRVRQVVADGRARTFDDYLAGTGPMRMAESSWAPWPDPAGSVAGVLAVYRDVTERQRLAAERRQLAQRLLEVQERERKGVSQFLHDHMGPLVIMAKMDLEQLGRHLAPDQRALAGQAMARLDEALRGIRHKALSLRPPLLDDLAVREALAFLVEQSNEQDGLHVTLDPVPTLPDLSPALKTCLFRVLQEALQRVADQAPQAEVRVTVVERGPLLAMTICDNGPGLDPMADTAHRPLGWVGMREIVQSLGGDLSVRAEAGRGSCVEIVVPRDEAGAGGSP